MTRPYRISDEARRERAERMKRLNADPEFAAKQAAAATECMKRLHADPEFVAKQAAAASERMKRLHADPEFEQKRIAAIRNRLSPKKPMFQNG